MSGFSGAADTCLASDVIHLTHFTGIKGDFGLECMDCHQPSWNEEGYYQLELSYEKCSQCHSPDGAVDGMNDPEIGAWNQENWPDNNGVSRIFDQEGHLRPGKEKWCLGCHDDGTSSIHGVQAPNVAGQSVTGDWQSPPALVATNFGQGQNLLDNNLATGATNIWGNELVFDLGQSEVVSHIRLYVATTDTTSFWEVYGSNDRETWERVLLGREIIDAAPAWQAGTVLGWNERKLDKFTAVRYVKLVKKSPWPLIDNIFREFQYKSDIRYGYLINGHKFSCDNCHDTTAVHVDGVARTYRSALRNYTAGYRLADVAVGPQVLPAMEIPRSGCNDAENTRTGNDFALCFSCHDRYMLLGDGYGTDDFYQDPLQTGFRNENHVDDNGQVANEHLRHLSGRGYCGNGNDWDSDWDTIPDSPQSCPACHNVHGSPNPAMTRHGELTSTPGTLDKVPMFNFQYLDREGKIAPDLLDITDSSGGALQFYAAGVGTPAKNNICNMCHGDLMQYSRDQSFPFTYPLP